MPVDSDALRANIAKTAQQVVIPDRYLPLVEAVQGYYGVRTPLVETLSEYFHTFRNVDLLIDGFQTILLRNWTYFERSDDRAQLFTLLSELVLDLLDTPLSTQQTSLLLRQLITWCTAALVGASLRCLRRASSHRRRDPVVGNFRSRPFAFLERDTLLHGLVRRAAARPALEPAFSALFRSLLLLGYRLLAERLPIPAWATSGEAELTDPQAVADRFAELAPEAMAELIARAESASEREAALRRPAGLLHRPRPGHRPGLPHRRHRGPLRRVPLLPQGRHPGLPAERGDGGPAGGGPAADEARAAHGRRPHPLPAHPLLPHARQPVPADALPVLRGHRRGHRAGGQRRRRPTTSSKTCSPGSSSTRRSRGPPTSGRRWSTPSTCPRSAAGCTSSSPTRRSTSAWRRLSTCSCGSAVSISPTPTCSSATSPASSTPTSRPIYFVAKQLLRAFPVYFNDVGAEGELRAVSTEIDEICGRQDTLMHFLRKQSHAESSNRLVDFSREVLAYWITLDPSGLQPYLSANTLDAVRRERDWATEPHKILVDWRDAAAPAGRGRPHTSPRGKRPSEQQMKDLLDHLAKLTPEALARLLDALPADGETEETARRRVALMVRTHQLLAAEVLALRRQRRQRGRPTICDWTARTEPASSRPWTPGGTNRDRVPGTTCSTPPSPFWRSCRRSSSARCLPSPSRTSTRSGTSRPASRPCTATTPSPSSTPWACRSGWRGWSPSCSTTWWSAAWTRTSPATPCVAWRRPSAASSGPSPPTASTHATWAPTCACSSRASAAITSPSTSIRTCSSSSWARSPSSRGPRS